jgi:inosine/xanthosine triphosphate pyrophosphatase family protein
MYGSIHGIYAYAPKKTSYDMVFWAPSKKQSMARLWMTETVLHRGRRALYTYDSLLFAYGASPADLTMHGAVLVE